jgi:large subunit ribosomal protein L5
MSTTETAPPPARLKERYLQEIRPQLIDRFGYSSLMQAPKIEKITLNMGVGLAKQDNKVLKAATEQLAAIAGQQPNVRRARKSIAAFKLREGMPVGLTVTLRAERAYEFLDRLISIAIPRIRDFRGLNSRSFDGRGNYSMGVKEQIIFPEIDYDAIDTVRGLDITITTSAQTDVEAYALLAAFGMPFSPQGRPKGYDPAADAQAEQDALAARAAKEQQSAAAAAEEAAVDEAVLEEAVAEAIVEEAVAEAVADELVAEVIAEAVVEEIVAEVIAEEIVAEVIAEEAVQEIVDEAVAEAQAEQSAQAPESETKSDAPEDDAAETKKEND